MPEENLQTNQTQQNSPQTPPLSQTTPEPSFPSTPQTPTEPTVEQNQVPMPKRKSPFVFIILLFFLVTLAAAGYYGYLYWQETNKKAPSPTTEPTPVETTDPTADWKTYTNTKYGYSFKHPSSWDTYTIGESAEGTLIIGPQEKVDKVRQMQGNFGGGTFLVLTLNIKTEVVERKSNEYEQVTSKPISINNINGTKFDINIIQDEPGFNKGDKITSVVVKKDDIYIQIDLLDQTYKDIFDQILSTFKFTSKDVDEDISKWKTWNDPADFTIKYPPTATVTNTNQKTQIDYYPGGEHVVIYLSQKEQNPICDNLTCDKSEEIEVKIASESAKVTQKWPDSQRNYTFQTKVPYPGKYSKLALTISAIYPSKENISEISKILSTLVMEVQK
jgi:predicted small lipoprotein YifL